MQQEGAVMGSAEAEQMLCLLLVGGCATSCSDSRESGLLEARGEHLVMQNPYGGNNQLQHEVMSGEFPFHT